jgi:phage gp46-like protein
MTGDIRFLQQLDFPAYAVQLDWLMTDQNLIADGYDLQSAVIVALGTDALAPVSEELPDPDATDRRGWWGDLDAFELWGGWPVGCLLWLLARAKITGPLAKGGSTVARADGWTRDAMKPFTQNLIASRIDVFAERIDTGRIDVGVTIYRGPEPVIELRYAELWDELGR